MADDLSDLEITVLCDLLDGPDANLRAHKRGPCLISLLRRDLSSRPKTSLQNSNLVTRLTISSPNEA